MNTILLSMPIKKERIAEFETFVKELLGQKRSGYKDMHARYGIKTTRIWTHTLGNNHYIMLYHELSDDLDTHMQKFTDSKHPFDLWLAEQLEIFYNMDDLGAMSAKPPKFIGEFILVN